MTAVWGFGLRLDLAVSEARDSRYRSRPPAHAPRVDWLTLRACVDVPVDVFYPVERRGHGDAYWRARMVCGGCLVRVECLAVCMDRESRMAGGRFGFCGGMTPTERDEL